MSTAGTQIAYLQGPGATANGNGLQGDTLGFDSAQQVEVVETAGGTFTLNLEGSFDGTNWYAVGYQQVDNTASPARAVTAISVTASTKHVYQVLDPYPQLRARVSSVAGGATFTVRVYCVA